MEMVAASKMRKAQERMRMARPYSKKIRNIAGHLSETNPDYIHPFMVKRDEIKKAGLIVLTTEKGLCGAMNTNVLPAVPADCVAGVDGHGIRLRRSCDCRLDVGNLPYPDRHPAGIHFHDADAGVYRPGARKSLRGH